MYAEYLKNTYVCIQTSIRLQFDLIIGNADFASPSVL